MLVDGLDAAIFLQELGGRLFAHAAHTGDVVRAVTDQALVINELPGLQPVPLLDAGLIVNDRVGVLAAGGQHPGVVVNELKGIGVAGDDEGLHSLLGCLAGQSAQHVVGFVTLGGENRDVEGFNDLVDALQLGGQFLGHGLTVGFVWGVFFVAKGPPHVKGHGDVVGPFVTEHGQEHGGKAIDGVGQFPLAGAEGVGPQGMVGAIGQGVAVNQNQFLVRHRQLPSNVVISLLSPSLYRFWREKSTENEGRRCFHSAWICNPGHGRPSLLVKLRAPVKNLILDYPLCCNRGEKFRCVV